MKLRHKVVVIASSLTLLGLTLGLGVTYWVLWSARLADLDADNRGLAERFVGAARDAPGGSTLAALESELVRPSGVSAAQVYRRNRLVWEGNVLDAPDPLDPAGLRGAAGARTVGGWRVYTAGEAGVTVQTGRRLAALRATLRPFFYTAPPLVVGLTLLSGLLAWTAAGLALRPLERLTRAAQEFTGSHPGEHPSSSSSSNPDNLELAGRDEAATLAQSFAALLARLQGERAREQSFLAYAAHELRTPISALRAGLEAVQLERTLPSPETCARFYRDALRLEDFAQNLLALARADAGEVRPAPLDLALLLADTYDRFQPLALERGYELALAASPVAVSVTVSADARLLEQALGNLIANALRHAPAGRVELACGAAGSRAYLEVKDAGGGWDGLGDEGLGLRVVRSVAHAHGGRLEVGSEVSGEHGTHVRLWLPNKDSAES